MSWLARAMQRNAEEAGNTGQEGAAKSQCECGTFRTPGVKHIKSDTGAVSGGISSGWCEK